MASFEVRDHLLFKDGEQVPFLQTTMHGGHITPKMILEHETAGSSFQGAVSTLTKWRRRGKASAHLLVDRDGSIVQLLPFNREAWHAGPSKWKKQKGLNRTAIGIELHGPGKLVRAGTKCVAWFGWTWPVDQCVKMSTKKHGAGWWLPFTQEQIDANLGICEALRDAYSITTLAGHYEVDTRGWKVDPNPLLSMDELRDRVLGDVVDVEAFPLKVGSAGEYTEAAQRRLKGLGYEQVGEADGIFGPMTRSAVLAWQAEEDRQLNGELHQSDFTALMKPEAKPMEIGAASQDRVAKKVSASKNIGRAAGGSLGLLGVEGATQLATDQSLWGIAVENLDAVVGQVAKVKMLGVTVSPESAGLTLVAVGAASVWYWARRMRG